MTRIELEGRVAIVDDGGSELGRAIALALAARGVRVVVCGPEERPLGETVGHVAFGGGKARHIVGTLKDAAVRAREVFGAPDLAIGDLVGEAELVAKHRIVVRAPDDVEPDHVAALVVSMCSSKLDGRVLTLIIS